MKQDKNQVKPTFFDKKALSGQAFLERNQQIVDSCDILLAMDIFDNGTAAMTFLFLLFLH